MSEQKKPRPFSNNEREIEVLKKAFADDTGEFLLLRAVRTLFLGFPISMGDANLVKSTFKDKELKLAFRRKLFPIFLNDVPIGEESDYWFGTEQEILDKPAETIKQIVESKQGALGMLERAMKLLDDPTKEILSEVSDMSLRPKTDVDPYQIGLIARNRYVRGVTTGLSIIKVIAGQKSETVEQAKKRLLEGSTR